jgi:hypothetical protein
MLTLALDRVCEGKTLIVWRRIRGEPVIQIDAAIARRLISSDP